jgi:ribonuclease Z
VTAKRLDIKCTSLPSLNTAVEGTPKPKVLSPMLQQIIDSGKVTKTAISRLAVVELRAECEVAGLPKDGLKADLVDRVLRWVQEQQHCSDSDSVNGALQGHGVKRTKSSSRIARKGKEGSLLASDCGDNQTNHDDNCNRNCNSNSSSSSSKSNGKTRKRASGSFEEVKPADVKVTWLGTSSGAPTNRRNVSCIAVRYGDDKLFLVDCGEGARNQLRLAGLDPAIVSHILITHLHGDHCFGIVGVLEAIGFARTGTPRSQEPVEIYGPPELHHLLIGACKAGGLKLRIPVVVNGFCFDPAKAKNPTPVDPRKSLFLGLQAPDQHSPVEIARMWQSEYESGSDQIVRVGLTWSIVIENGIRVTAAQLQHRVPCWGYVFSEPDQQVGSTNPIKGRKLVILGDTCDSSAIADAAFGCDLLSHEATFNKGFEEKARIATHSTAEQAGAFAKRIRARNLVLTHFSARYEQSDPYKKVWRQAREKGMTVQEMQSSVAASLADEARRVAGGARVYLANDFFTFTVPLRDSVDPVKAISDKFDKDKETETDLKDKDNKLSVRGRRALSPARTPRYVSANFVGRN